MTALILTLIDQLWPYLIAGLGALLTALLALWRAYTNGRKAELARQAEREARARDIRDQVVNDTSMLPPDKVRSELAKRVAK